MDFACVDEIENLHEYKDVENEGEMARIIASCVKGCEIIVRSIDIVKSAAADSASYYTVVPFVLWMVLIYELVVEGVHLFRNKPFSIKNKYR